MEKKEKEKESGFIEGFLGAFGLEKFVNAIKKSDVFKERFKEANEEIEERIKSGEAVAPPRIEGKLSIRPLAKGPAGRRERKPIKVRPKEKEIIVEVEEGEKEVKVIAELPGIEEKDIGLNLKNRTLLIKAGTARKYVYLPCAVQPPISKTFNNTILEVILKKKVS